jgi:signal transduction histidine kinase
MPILVFCAVAQEKGQPVIQNYLPKDYHQHHQNWNITQDSLGVIYAGNNYGVLRFDGSSWSNFPTPRGGLVRSVAAAPDGKIYAGAVGEFGYLARDYAGRMQWHMLSDELDSTFRNFADVWRIFPTSKGVYFSSFQYLFLFSHHGELIRVWQPLTQFRPSFVLNDRFFIHQIDDGLYEMAGDSLVKVPGHLPKDALVYAMLPSNEGFVIQTRSHGVFRLTGNGIEPHRWLAAKELDDRQVYDAMMLSDGRYAFATLRGGLVVTTQDGRIERIVTKSVGLPDNCVYDVFEDRSGSVWLALNNGISRVELISPLSVFNESSGLEGSVFSISRHREKVYAGTNLGVFQLNERDFEHPWRFVQLPGLRTQSWALLSTGDRLLAATSSGIYLITDQTARPIDPSYSFVLYRSPSDTTVIYVGHRQGIGRLRLSPQQVKYDRIHSEIDEEIRYIAETPDGSLWLAGAFDGFIRIHDGRVMRLHPNSDVRSRANRIFQISQGALFVTDRGVMVYDAGDSLRLDTTISRLLPNEGRDVMRLAEDQWKQLWIRRERLETGKISTDSSGEYLSYTPFSRISQLADVSLIWPEGRYVWFGGYDGLLLYRGISDPWMTIRNPIPGFSNLMITVMLGSDSILYAGNGNAPGTVELPYDFANLHFEIATPGQFDVAPRRFQYRLLPGDSVWKETSEKRINYSRLPDGSHIFEVRLADVHLRNQITRFPFSVATPFYRQWWAILLAMTGISGLFVLIMRIRQDVLERERGRLQALIDQQTAALQSKNAELLQVNEKKNEYLGVVAHDLRNPLTIIMGYAHVLSMDLSEKSADYEEMKKNIDYIIRTTEHMNRFVTELLDIASIEAGKVRLEKDRFDLTELVTQCAHHYQRQAIVKEIILSLIPSRQPRMVDADQFKINAVLDNLITNAIKYTRPGGNVTIQFDDRDGQHVVHVRDTGLGLSPEDLKRIFVSFKRLSAKPTAGEPSTGLGLAIVKKVVEIHGGRVWVESEKNKGSQFSFSLPKA